MSAQSRSRQQLVALQLLGLFVITSVAFLGGTTAVLGMLAFAIVPVVGILIVRLAEGRSETKGSSSVSGEALKSGESGEPFPALAAPMLVAGILHVVLSLVLHLSGAADSLAPDHMLYRHWGRLLASNVGTAALVGELGYNPNSVYYYINAVAWFLGERQSSLLMGILNGALHVVTSYLIAQIAYSFYGRRAANAAFLLFAFFPSLLVYASLNIRDSLSWLFIAISMRGALRIREPGGVTAGILLLAGGLIGTGFVRTYIMMMLLVSFGAAQMVTRVRKLPYALLGLMALVAIALFAGPKLGLSMEMLTSKSLQDIQIARTRLDGGASAAGFQGTDVSNFSDALLFLPRGLIFFLLSPFPWQVNNARQALALPEVALWLVLLVLAGRQVLEDIRVRTTQVATLLFPTIAITMTYALMEGNAGTANRHRGQMVGAIVIFGSRSIARYLASRGKSAGSKGFSHARSVR